MKISLITITRNNLDGLKRTVSSIMRQNRSDVEYIIVDGYSTDGTKDYLATLPSQFRVIYSEPKGVYNAINVGIKNATGQLIGMLNAGDVYNTADVLKIVANKFETHSDLQYLYGDVYYCNKRHTRVTRYYSGQYCDLSTVLKGFAPPHPTLFMTAETIKTIGLYDESYVIAGDFDLFIRLFSASKIKGTYLPLDMIEMAPGGISSSLKSLVYTNNMEKSRALHANGYGSRWVMLCARYYYILISTLCHKKKSV